MNFPQNSESCSNCKQFFLGYGFNFSYRLAKYAYFDSGAKLFPGSGSCGQNGTAQEGLVGLKLGPTLDRWGFFFNLRNGFIHYDKTLVPGRSFLRKHLALGSRSWSHRRILRLRAIPLSVSMAAPPSFTTSRAIPIPISRPPAFSPHAFQGSPDLTSGYVFRFCSVRRRLACDRSEETCACHSPRCEPKPTTQLCAPHQEQWSGGSDKSFSIMRVGN